MALRKAQYDTAIGGNATLLIWLGKQELDQTDKMTQTITDEVTVTLKRT
jgi:hypothetical protein